MLAYLNDTVDEFDLRQHIHTSVEVIKAHWIDEKNTWCVRLKDLQSKVEFNRYCTILISAAGFKLTSGPEVPDGNNVESGGQHKAVSNTTLISNKYIPFLQRLRQLEAFLSLELPKILPIYSTEHRYRLDIDGNNPIQTPDYEPAHAGVDIIGSRDGISLSQYWKETRGPQAYWGCLAAGFPNFGMVSARVLTLTESVSICSYVATRFLDQALCQQQTVLSSLSRLVSPTCHGIWSRLYWIIAQLEWR
jgi:hypothetical protein